MLISGTLLSARGAEGAATSAPAAVSAAARRCLESVIVENRLPNPVTLTLTAAPFRRLRRVGGGESVRIPVGSSSRVSLSVRGHLAAPGVALGSLDSVRLTNQQSGGAEVILRAADGRQLAAARLRGRGSESVRLNGYPTEVRVAVKRGDDGRAAEIMAGALLGGAAARRANEPANQATTSATHYHNGVACNKPECAPTGGTTSANQRNDVAGALLDAAAHSREAAPAASGVFTADHPAEVVGGVAVAVAPLTGAALRGPAFAEQCEFQGAGGGAVRLAGGGVVVAPGGACDGGRRGNCEEGAWRWKQGGAAKSCSFDAPSQDRPTIRLVGENPHGAYGGYAAEGADQALGELAQTLSALSSLKTLVQVHGNASASDGEGVGGDDAVSLWGGIVGDQTGIEIPTSPEELPSAYAINALKMGQQMADAAGRWSRAHARGMVTLVAEVEMTRFSIKCKEIELCRNGYWVPGGWWTDGRPQEERLEPRRLEINEIHIGQGASGMSELNRAMGRVETWLRQIRFHEMNAKRYRLQNSEDPCGVCGDRAGTPPADGSGTGPGGGDCDSLRRQLREAQQELNSVRGARDEYQTRLTTAEREKSEVKVKCDRDLAAARTEVDAAREAWRTAIRRLHDLERYGGVRNGARHDAAAALERETKARLDRANARLETLQSECTGREQQLDAEINLCRSQIALSDPQLGPLERKVADLTRNLESCERSHAGTRRGR